MKKTFIIILSCSLLSILFHLYLSSLSYSAYTDVMKDSFACNLSSNLNCQKALLSSYSHFAGIPIANWGMALHIITFLLSLVLIGHWTEKPQIIWTLLLKFSLISAGASLAMMGISWLLISTFCPICVILYALSFIILIGVWHLKKKYYVPFSIKKELKPIAGWLISWIATSFVIHLILSNAYNINPLKQTVADNIIDWRSSPAKYTEAKALLTYGPSSEEADITIIEFADFLCPYCKKSHFILSAIQKAQPNIRVEYFSFPLDECQGKTASCLLTKAVYCAEKQKMGWNMQKIIFQNQEQFITSKEDLKHIEHLKTRSKNLTLNWDQWMDCLNSPSAIEISQKQIQAGKDMGVTQTPSIFINNKAIVPLYLNKTIQEILKQKKPAP